MKQRLADYVADFFVSHNIQDCFMVVGGGAMHLNDALGHKEGLCCTFCHHEQACAVAAEAYARVNNQMAAVCVTTGPGGTNAITGVLGAWLDSIPMFVVSGQVRYDTTVRYISSQAEGAVPRAVGDQEYDITKAVSYMCKYAVMLEDPLDIRYVLEQAYARAMEGRRGPVWVDIPLDFQGCMVETEKLRGYGKSEKQPKANQVPMQALNEIVSRIRAAERPVFYAGNGIRLSGGYAEFRRTMELLGIPIVACWDSVDVVEGAHPLYTGRGGIMGDRAGNFAVQNADLVLAVGARLSIRQVGYRWDTWARGAFVIMVDIDPEELKKPTLHVELPVCADAKVFFEALNERLSKESCPLFKKDGWRKQCLSWREKYPVTQPKHWQEDGRYANVYAFVRYLSQRLLKGSLTVVSNGSACVVGSQNYVIQKDGRFLINSGAASMGYGLPAAVGACIAAGRREIVCLEGDGSIMMNLQELQTIQTLQLPVKLFVIHNGGYHSIRQTQNSFFAGHSRIGIGPESGGLSFPEFKKVAQAFGYFYMEAHSNAQMVQMVDAALDKKGSVFCEVFVSPEQNFEPKSAAKRLLDGSMESPPLEDMAPFLPREELLSNLYIDAVE
ncbi:MAG: thiamine pyrophosphate-binding protein [Eubacterium sp.]|nr:thiamine pyrophosphate-binding protein [Eubacterium sp.]